ncbi:MAG: precorrin-2 dehydrogenase/sirohydrochlorin ferrochelatase family protein [Bryobacteraceae bacterium]
MATTSAEVANLVGQTTAAPQLPHYYPVLLDLRGRRCLVLGVGQAARLRVQALADAGAQVSHLAGLMDPERVSEYFLCVAVGLPRAVNAGLYEAALRHGVLFDAVDDPDHSHFIHPAIHRQGGLIIAVSTSGACPALAVRIRDELAARYGPEFGQFVAACGRIRKRMAELIADFESRRAAWYALVDGWLSARLTQPDSLTAEDLLEEVCKNFGLTART